MKQHANNTRRANSAQAQAPRLSPPTKAAKPAPFSLPTQPSCSPQPIEKIARAAALQTLRLRFCTKALRRFWLVPRQAPKAQEREKPAQRDRRGQDSRVFSRQQRRRAFLSKGFLKLSLAPKQAPTHPPGAKPGASFSWIALALLALCWLGCPRLGAPQAALPGCRDASPTQSRAERDAAAARALSQGRVYEATRALRQAACYPGIPDALGVEAVARAVVLETLRIPAHRVEAATLLLSTNSGPEEVRAFVFAQPDAPELLPLWLVLAGVGEKKAEAPLRAALFSADETLRAEILAALGNLGVLRPEEIEAAYQDQSPVLRAVAVELWAKQEPAQLERAAQDSDPTVRREVASRLGALSPETGAVLAGVFLSDSDPGVRLSALEVSLRLGYAKEESISQALSGDDPFLAVTAARLAGAQDTRAVETLERLLSQPGTARSSAILAASSFTEEAKRLTPPLRRITNTGTPEEQVLAAAALLRLSLALPSGRSFREADRDAHETLQQRCEGEGRPAMRACAELAPRGDARAVERLRRAALADPDPSARTSALRSLTLAGEASLHILAAGLADQDPAVRLAAARAVFRVVGTTPRPHGR